MCADILSHDHSQRFNRQHRGLAGCQLLGVKEQMIMLSLSLGSAIISERQNSSLCTINHAVSVKPQRTKTKNTCISQINLEYELFLSNSNSNRAMCAWLVNNTVWNLHHHAFFFFLPNINERSSIGEKQIDK